MKPSKIIAAALFAITAASTLLAQTIGGPVLGFVLADAGSSLLPIIGVPGASAVGTPIPLATDHGATAVSPGQDYALAAGSASNPILLIDLTRAEFPASVVSGTHSGGTAVGISRSGDVAAVYSPVSQTVQIVGGLPRSPRLLREFNTPGISQAIDTVVVNDVGSVVLLGTEGAMWAVDEAGAPWQIPATQPSSAAFLAGTRDAVITDDTTRKAFMFGDLGRSNTLVLLAAAQVENTFTAVSSSEDGRRVFLAGTSGDITIVELSSRLTTRLDCSCSPTSMSPMKGHSVFRLTEPSGEPMMMLDASSAGPRIVITPPRASQ